MAKKKNITEDDLVTNYMDYILTNGKNPDSVFSFSKQYNFKEEDYYKFYGNFSALEQSIFKIFYDKTVFLLEKNNEYRNYSPRDKMFSFYYSFFELLTANRDWYNYTIDQFGPDRCMFESNFPVDKLSCSYTILWNQFKKLTAGFSSQERAAMFHDTAMRIYRLPQV